jgi:demethylmenaquinone methyltransferase/2-methoxy-6-polyprenyl-1,4-benzoquinol methylase
MSEFMIDLAQEKQIRYSAKDWMQHKRLSWHVADAVNTGLDIEGYDIVSCAFGIRNLSDCNGALNEIHRLLKTNGKLYILEFSLPGNPILRFAYTMYLCHIMPFFGKIVIGSRDAIRYLAQSIRHWHMNIDFAAELDQTGFRFLYKTPLSGGVVTLWVAVKK